MTYSLTRRAALGAAAALPLISTAQPLIAKGSIAPAKLSLSHSYQVGDMTVTTLLDGSALRDGPKEIFGQNVSTEEFSAVSARNFISAEMTQFYFTPTLVQAGQDLVLFDTGLGRGGLQAALSQVGVTPDQIDIVVITHMHPDHIGGLMNDQGPVFANARYVTGATEFDFWSKFEPGHRVGDLVAKNVVPLAEKMQFLSDGDSVTSGITALAAVGHTPGHMVYMLESNGQQLVLTADLANHYVWSFAHPDWEVRFDMDKAAAAKARRHVLGMLAADRLPMIGYHMPFPAAGYVETRDDGFRFVPHSYQLNGR